ncbi:DUF3180 domain-containing protein [Gryllotalpicola protaetiae]|uniref:DUF3180 domain-containing protein n=1 Tax=Gryllotalpicola protaetiae TaxID=2419771 RepID=A0A387BPT4_9MICO|nr:DUF3180 domain-containing protein [Gryllotalpicola protaetiae]AYG03119.1 DUF3180 domain-containing protein [Gryllotalpicola protaetiae]
MKRTHPTTLVIVGLIGTVAGLLTDAALAASGRALIVPPVTLSVTLAVIAIIVVVLAVPIRRAIRGKQTLRIDPFRAARTAVLAKACSVLGALLTGLPLGLLLFMLTRTVLADTSSIVLTVSAVVGGALLLVGGLLAEWFCTLPPDDPDAERDAERGPEPGASRSHA